jgi:hypothetical protein
MAMLGKPSIVCRRRDLMKVKRLKIQKVKRATPKQVKRWLSATAPARRAIQTALKEAGMQRKQFIRLPAQNSTVTTTVSNDKAQGHLSIINSRLIAQVCTLSELSTRLHSLADRLGLVTQDGEAKSSPQPSGGTQLGDFEVSFHNLSEYVYAVGKAVDRLEQL